MSKTDHYVDELPTISFEELRRNPGKIREYVKRGEALFVIYRSRPIAKIVPLSWKGTVR